VRLEDALREGSLGLAYDLRYLALEGYCNGHYRVARSLQQILLNAGFEVPSTLCHLGRIALMTGNFQTALRHAGRAWRMREQAPDYVVPRILWLQAAVVLLQAAGSNSLGSIIGKFKTVMQTAYSCDWNLTPLLDRLGQRLEGQDYELLKAMSDAINDHDKLAELDAFPVWRTTAAEAVS